MWGLLTILALCGLGCGTIAPTQRLIIAKELQPFYDEFIGEVNKRSIILPPVVGRAIIEEGVITSDSSEFVIFANCSVYAVANNPYYFVIRVTREVMNTKSYINIRSIFFHEAGHCMLGLGHANEDENSLMTPILDDALLNPDEEQWKKLVDELFTR